MKEISIEYRDKTIRYNQDRDEWTCKDFTHNRGSPTLTLAKARIDKILEGPVEKPKAFEKVTVWANTFNFHREWSQITLTGKTEDGFWATKGKERKKLSEHDSKYGLKAFTPENTAKIEEIKAKHAQIDALRGEISKIEQTLKPYKHN